MPITNTYGNKALDTMFAAPRYLALLTGDPGPTGLMTQEFVGGGYVRKLSGFSTAASKSVGIYNSNVSVWWSDLPNLPIRFIAVCTAISGGEMVAYKATGADIYVTAGNKFILNDGWVAFTISDV
jgi:hypothetical protein